MKFWFVLVLLFWCVFGFAQDTTSLYTQKRIPVSDSVVLDSLSINPSYFKINTKNGKQLDSLFYKINFSTAKLLLSPEVKNLTDTLVIAYLRYPDFLTKKYAEFDPKIIVNSNQEIINKLQKLEEQTVKKEFKPFEGLNTIGSITRGITVGNNQNAVVNSELDLQITGKLNENISIRASIQDANIPTQTGGYSQRLDEFDQIFIELFSDNWNIRAGDINLENTQSFFGNFTKKVQGLSLNGVVSLNNGDKLAGYASGALVRGVYSKSQFTGQDGNQGPYKLIGPNEELFILIVSGSERVYVNGILLERGENNDYVIDYNAGEITFNETYPVTDAMRITVEYQFTDQNYTRFMGYGGGKYTSQKWDMGVYVYSESDLKNQPLQQSLSPEQVTILQQAGDNTNLMVAPSAVLDSYSENKILYKKEINNGVEIFVFSNNPEDELYTVKFTFVGDNMGNYIISQTNTISRVFEYIPPLNGVPQGNYEPVIQLKPPEQLQVGGFTSNYKPSEKTQIYFEAAGSKKDNNLFSKINDSDNTGFAGRLSINQMLLKKDSLQLKGFITSNYVHKNFTPIERLYNIEFSRDWSLSNPLGDQTWIASGLDLNHLKKGRASYVFERLNYTENFSGNRHTFFARLQEKNWTWKSTNSFLKNNQLSEKATFLRTHNTLVYSHNKKWIGAEVASEDQQVRYTENDSLTPISQRFISYKPFVGIGDSTQVFAALGYRYRVTDSVITNKLARVNTSNTFYIKTQLLQAATTNLQIFGNYRIVRRTQNATKEKTLNARILYRQNLFSNTLRLNTTLSTNNGVLPQQEFTYVKVAQGEGIYTWIDYNNNAIQELEEFEIAQFQDQAEYIRILLPNKIFIKTRENKISQLVTIDPSAWSKAQTLINILTHFYNQTSFIIQRKVKKDNQIFEFNPFKGDSENVLGLVKNLKNVLFFNRGKQHYTTSYSYINSATKNTLSIGQIQSILEVHQLQFVHKIQQSWLVNLDASKGNKSSINQNFNSRDYRLHTSEIQPKIAYLFSKQNRIELYYQYKTKENQVQQKEKLNQQKWGVSFSYSKGQNTALNGEINYIKNAFSGNSFSPVSYEILEGLQPGINLTWQVLLQKKITKFLDLNISYFGRKSEQSKTIHTGSMQLKAYF